MAYSNAPTASDEEEEESSIFSSGGAIMDALAEKSKSVDDDVNP